MIRICASPGARACSRLLSVPIVLLLLTLRPAAAQHEPFLGPHQYPQFRYLSGLAGGGYGVDEQGYASLSGPTAYSTPIAYVLGHDQFLAGIGKTSYSSAPNLAVNHANGKAAFTFGHTFGQANFAVTDLFKSNQLDQAYNLQIDLMPLNGSPVVPSIGVQDLLGLGGSAGDHVPTDHQSSRSIFGVLTWRIDTTRSPVFVSAGIGTHRFAKGFASGSYRLGGPWRVWLEYDGWGFNEGVLIAAQTRGSKRKLTFSADAGLIRGRYLTLATSVSF